MKLTNILILILFTIVVNFSTFAQYSTDNQDSNAENGSVLNLEECVEMALEFSKKRTIAEYSIKIAEAQYKQATSAYWPELNLTAAYNRFDEDPNFIFPAFKYNVENVPFIGSFSTEVPQMDIKLMDKQAIVGSIDLKYPLYTGGLISSYVDQAESAIEIANQELRKSKLEILHDVKKYYHAVVLSNIVYDIGKETFDRLSATLELTKNVYEKGSGRVKKTDYLKNKIIVENVKGLVSSLKNKSMLAKSALKNVIGMKRTDKFEIEEKKLIFKPYLLDLENFIGDGYEFNPDWLKVASAIKVFQARLDGAKSGHYPKVAIIGSIKRIENSYDFGMATPENKTMLSIGIGVELPIFQGFRTVGQVDEASARLNKLKEQKIYFKDGLALLIEKSFYDLKAVQERLYSLGDALNSTQDYLSLTERAYQIEMMEEKDLLEAQIMEAFMRANYQLNLFEHICARLELEYIIGKEIERKIMN